MLKALQQEIILRSGEFRSEKVETIYFGGGTSSILTVDELIALVRLILDNFSVSEDAEITMEANPDDLTEQYLETLKLHTPVNRFSIGTQSFRDEDLKLMNRRHNAREAFHSIELAHQKGFKNLNIDLIYGVPGMRLSDWKKNLEIFASLDIPHLSAYHLSFEPKTVFMHFLKKGKLMPIDEEESTRQFEYLLGFTTARGYEHYEISNFARNESWSKHNLSYWTGKPYLGFGPSAHSFKPGIRRWNIANNTRYCELLEKGDAGYFEEEQIDTPTAYHDYLLTSLRTKWGIDPVYIREQYGEIIYEKFSAQALPFLHGGTLVDQENRLVLSDKGKFIADHVISALMLEK